jgi:hypothetical protein
MEMRVYVVGSHACSRLTLTTQIRIFVIPVTSAPNVAA